MDKASWHSTLREMRALFVQPRIWGGIFTAVLLLGLSGPFGTIDMLAFGPRLIYWLAIVLSTYASGSFFYVWVNAHLNAAPKWRMVVKCSLANTIVVSVLLLLVNWIALQASPFEIPYMLWMVGNALAVSVIIYSFIIFMAAPASMSSPPHPPAILKRLELAKRGVLISMTVQDHYVDVVTSKGSSLLLMRLTDAISETAPVAGLQIHRSHWVATSQIKNAQRRGDRAMVTLLDGRELPVSRTYLKQLKQLALLPN